ncbi:MAG: hypothetical protein J0I41_15655 [Filimonas sp.]|nr:hypothetical protein [Filimonas sp.]
MFHLILAMFWAFACPNHNSNNANNHNNPQVTAADENGGNNGGDDTTGETGHIPTKPPTNP